MRQMYVVALALLTSAACAKAGDPSDLPGPDDDPLTPDSPRPPDAQLIDAAQMATLHQTADTTLATQTISCANGDDETAELSFYRAFALADHDIDARPFYVSEVVFGVQSAFGDHTVQVKLGLYTGTLGATSLDLAAISPVNAATATVPNTNTPMLVTVPLTATIPADAQFVVEIASPDGRGNGKSFFMGSATSVETRGAYYRTPVCNRPNAQTLASYGFGTVHPVIGVTGQY